MKPGDLVPSTIDQEEIDVISESEDFAITSNVGEQKIVSGMSSQWSWHSHYSMSACTNLQKLRWNHCYFRWAKQVSGM